MARGGYRPGGGRPKGSKNKSSVTPETAIDRTGIPSDVRKASKKAGLTPLDYMLKVMNNSEADQARRDRMAIAAAPFCHARVADNRMGKGDAAAAAAEEAAAGKFQPPKAPKLVVDNG